MYLAASLILVACHVLQINSVEGGNTNEGIVGPLARDSFAIIRPDRKGVAQMVSSRGVLLDSHVLPNATNPVGVSKLGELVFAHNHPFFTVPGNDFTFREGSAERLVLVKGECRLSLRGQTYRLESDSRSWTFEAPSGPNVAITLQDRGPLAAFFDSQKRGQITLFDARSKRSRRISIPLNPAWRYQSPEFHFVDDDRIVFLADELDVDPKLAKEVITVKDRPLKDSEVYYVRYLTEASLTKRDFVVLSKVMAAGPKPQERAWMGLSANYVGNDIVVLPDRYAVRAKTRVFLIDRPRL